VALGLALSQTQVQAEVVAPCADACRFEVGVPESRCQLWEASSDGWIAGLEDGTGQLHNRARYHTAWLNHWMRPVGGVMAAEFTDETLSAIRSYSGRRDSPIWTGSYLAAEALRFMTTGAPDAERALSETVATLHRWWNISGDRGYLARYAAPADSPEPVLALLNADEPEVHRDVTYENGRWHWRGNISRDQYQGAILGYSLAYEATRSSSLRAIIREDVVRFIEQLMDSENQQIRIRIQSTTVSQNIRVPYAVFSRADAPDGIPTLTLQLTPFDAAGEGVLFFSPNAAELVRQLPGFGSFPDVYQSTEAIQLGAMFNVALQVTEGVPEYAERRRAIAEHYARHADTWLDIAARWRNTNRCDSGYFGLNIGFMPLYTWTRLETDPARRDQLQRTVLRDALWAEVADHKNVFFAFIYASQAPAEDDTRPVLDAHVAQLARFSTAPNLSRPIDLRGLYPESASCPGISAEAVNVDERPATSFTWERHPWKLQDAGTPNMTYGGVDYLLAYWMGRHHGFIADDAPETCLLWKS
jgi:hypothetical protein